MLNSTLEVVVYHLVYDHFVYDHLKLFLVFNYEDQLEAGN